MPEELRRWLVLFRIPLALLGILLLFTLYNRYLVDTNLQNLRSSLTILSNATKVRQAEAALLLVDQALNSQMSEEDLDLQNLTTLQYAQGTLAHGQKGRTVSDTQAMLSILEEDRALARPVMLSTLDSVMGGVQNAWRRTTLLPRQVFSGSLSNIIDEARMAEAIRLEGAGRLQEASTVFEALVKEYPDYQGRVSLKLRLGSLYQKNQDERRARKLYSEALRQSLSIQEADIARQMLRNLSETRNRQKNARTLELQMDRAESAIERQQIAFELGASRIRSSELLKAAEAFHEAVEADPESALASVARFKEAWSLRYAGRLEEALALFMEIIRRNPKSNWAATAYQQIAEIYRATGDLATAAKAYEQAIAQGKEDAVTAVLYVQTGSTYRFDLQNAEKADQFFREAQMKYPASAFSAVPRKQEEIARRSGEVLPPSAPVPLQESETQAIPGAPKPPPSLTSAALSEGSPLINWLENFLPVFVDVFADRLAKFMGTAGEKTLTRRFTDIEFRDLVAREVQRRFPSQVTDIQAKIHPDGFVGTGNVRLGMLSFPLRLRVGVTVVNEKPNVILHEISVAKFPVPKALLTYLEKRVNQSVQKARYPLRVKEYVLHEGYALVSVELVGN